MDGVRFSVENERIVVRCEYAHRERCKTVPRYAWDASLGAWLYPARPDTATALRDAFDGVQPRRGSPAFVALLGLDRPITPSPVVNVNGELPPIPLYRLPPWEHQIRAFWTIVNVYGGLPEQRKNGHAEPAGAALFMSMGTGKSRVALDVLINMRMMRTLILAPLSVVDSVWLRQIETHAGDSIWRLALGSGSRSVTDKARAAEAMIHAAGNAKVPVAIITNYDSAWREPLKSLLLHAGFDFLVMDESHRAKAPASKVSHFVTRLGREIPYKLALTGTPMPHSPGDVYAQYRALNPSIFGTSYQAFLNQYAIIGGYNRQQVVGWKNRDELHRKIYSIAFRVEAKDVLDLPPVRHEVISVTLSPSAQRTYNQLERDFIAEVEAGTVTAGNALAKLLRLQQITSGFVRTEDGVDAPVDDSKRSALGDLLDALETREPVVVFCRFHHDLDLIRAVCESQGRRCAELSGRRKEIDAWQRGDADVLATQVQAGGVGVDLSRAAYCIFYSLGFSLGDYDQCLARVHRPGQTRPVLYYHLIADHTVDTKVYGALRSKRDVVQAVLEEHQKKPSA